MKPLLVLYINVGNSSACKAREITAHIYDSLKSQFNDEYFIIVLPVREQETKVEVFYDKDLKQESLEEIKQEILNKISKQTPRGSYLVKFVDSNKLYPVSYTIKQDGTKVYEQTYLLGLDLTKNQIVELFNKELL